MIHDDYINEVSRNTFSSADSYFRMKYDLNEIETVEIPEGFSIRDAKPVEESNEISSLIGKCYDDLKPTRETVEGWTEHLVFDDKLWIWILDDIKGKKAGLGIGEIHKYK